MAVNLNREIGGRQERRRLGDRLSQNLKSQNSLMLMMTKRMIIIMMDNFKATMMILKLQSYDLNQ